MKNLADIIPQDLLQLNPVVTTEFTKFCLATGTEFISVYRLQEELS